MISAFGNPWAVHGIPYDFVCTFGTTNLNILPSVEAIKGFSATRGVFGSTDMDGWTLCWPHWGEGAPETPANTPFQTGESKLLACELRTMNCCWEPKWVAPPTWSPDAQPPEAYPAALAQQIYSKSRRFWSIFIFRSGEAWDTAQSIPAGLPAHQEEKVVWE